MYLVVSAPRSHNDLPWQLRKQFNNQLNNVDLYTLNTTHTNIPKIKEGRLGAQVGRIAHTRTVNLNNPLRCFNSHKVKRKCCDITGDQNSFLISLLIELYAKAQATEHKRKDTQPGVVMKPHMVQKNSLLSFIF